MFKAMKLLNLSFLALVFYTFGCKTDFKLPIQQYTDPQFHFRVSVPNSKWIISDSTGISDVLVLIKSKQKTGAFFPNITISTEYVGKMVTAKEYGKQNINALAKQNFQIQSEQNLVQNQIKFYWIQCVNKNFSPALRFYYFCFVKDKVGFVITATAPVEYFQSLEQDFKKIISSFQFI